MGEEILPSFLLVSNQSIDSDTSERTMKMKKMKLSLQFFADGGDGAGTGFTGSNIGGSEGAETGEFANPKKGSLENVIYGKASNEEVTKPSTETKAQAFENLIKGEYKEEFAKRTQGIINERFKNTKGIEAQLKSHEDILTRLADKYGTKAGDIEALTKAIDEDESFYEKEALEKGLSVSQLKEVKRLERENETLRREQQEAKNKENGEKLYAQWLDEGKALSEKYGLANFDLSAELENPDFVGLLRSGISLEASYKAVHVDDLIGGAMAQTAMNVREKMAADISSNQARPSENGATSQSAAIFKTDVNKLTKADREEIDRRVARGEIITF